MKKVALLLSFVFVAILGMNAIASTVVVDNNTVITVVDIDFDKKPCPADCQKECCTKKADCKTKEAKANCTAEKKACCKSKTTCDGKKTEKDTKKKK